MIIYIDFWSNIPEVYKGTFFFFLINQKAQPSFATEDQQPIKVFPKQTFNNKTVVEIIKQTFVTA